MDWKYILQSTRVVGATVTVQCRSQKSKNANQVLVHFVLLPRLFLKRTFLKDLLTTKAITSVRRPKMKRDA